MTQNKLPPGQKQIDHLPRFGLTPFADRYRSAFDPLQLELKGQLKQDIQLNVADLQNLERLEQVCDFHCVTTWSVLQQHWHGYLFADFYHAFIEPNLMPGTTITHVIFKAQDGYRSCMQLNDLLTENVILADTLNHQPLSPAHGQPLRLVAPNHYGYKSIKHLKSMCFCVDDSSFKPPSLRFLVHPRARVALEERGLYFPGWLLRYAYRPLIKPTIARFKRAMQQNKDLKD